MAFEYLKTAWKKALGAFLMFGGFGLMIEHWINYGEFDFFDFIGHEWLGLIVLLIGAALLTNFTYFNPIQYAKEKLKAIFKRNA